jgi:hypothetical protein
VFGLLIVGLAGVTASLVGFGYVTPTPDCCDSGGGTPVLGLAADRESVILLVSLSNPSGRSLIVERADVDLPGARVLDVAIDVDDPSGPRFPPAPMAPPVVLTGNASAQLVIRFVPDDCRWNSFDPWGSAVLHLEVDHDLLPSIGRDVRFGALVDPGRNDLLVLPPQGADAAASMRDPLMAACAMLAA